MKDRAVRRGVQSAQGSRKPGSAPALGRVSRMPGYGRRGQRRRRDRGEEYLTQRQRQHNWQVLAWSVGIGVVSAAVLAAAFTFWLFPILHDGKNAAELTVAAADAQTRVATKFKSPTQDEALALVKKALALRDVQQVEELIRTGPLSAAEVVSFLAAMPTVDGQIKDYQWLRSIDKNGLSLEGVLVTFAAAGKTRSRLAILTPDVKGVWKLDFAAFARWVKPSWEVLLQETTGSGVVRVYATKDNYFNGPFKDERVWAAYKLISPDTEQIMVGYCKIGSAQYRAMDLLWQRGETAVARVTLEIQHPQDAAGSQRWQFEISRVLAEDWVLGNQPLDQGL